MCDESVFIEQQFRNRTAAEDTARSSNIAVRNEATAKDFHSEVDLEFASIGDGVKSQVHRVEIRFVGRETVFSRKNKTKGLISLVIQMRIDSVVCRLQTVCHFVDRIACSHVVVCV